MHVLNEALNPHHDAVWRRELWGRELGLGEVAKVEPPMMDLVPSYEKEEPPERSRSCENTARRCCWQTKKRAFTGHYICQDLNLGHSNLENCEK